ncbi:MAG: hypothetical protein IKU76_03695 [Bacteroidaceae bacterium]|nr:hypothetical protein [Bacteroidaceae bacterium]
MRNNSEIRLQRVVAYYCATLFALFSFSFMAFYQAPLLEMLYDHVATGKLEFNAFVVSAVVTAFLTLLAIWLNRFARFQREWTAMAYLPSSLILAFITDIDRSVYTGEWSAWGWIATFMTGMFLYLFFSFVLNRMLFEKIKDLAMSTNRIIWRNLILLVILFSAVGMLSSSDGNIKRESFVASYLKKGDLAKALNVGYEALEASKELTALRAFVMSKEGSLGERLFEYPQYYGAGGLLPAKAQNSPLVPDSVFAMLGDVPRDKERPVDYFERVAAYDSAATVAKDYYLSALLLEKRLPDFKECLYQFCDTVDVDRLPKHYREALFLYSTLEPEYSVEFLSDSMSVAFDSLRSIEARYDDIITRNNYVRRDFGRTYWWYFLYSD